MSGGPSKEKLFVELPEKTRTEPESKEHHSQSRTSKTHHSKDATRPSFTVEGRVIRSRLDFGPAKILQDQFGFPRQVIARTLRIRFENYHDDFETFPDFFDACKEVAQSFGIAPPQFGKPVVVSDRSRATLSTVKEDGTLIDERTNVVNYTSSEGASSHPVPSRSWSLDGTSSHPCTSHFSSINGAASLSMNGASNRPPRGRCWQCEEHPAEYVTAPCRHCSLCSYCADKVVTYCPQCRTKVEEIYKVFR